MKSLPLSFPLLAGGFVTAVIVGWCLSGEPSASVISSAGTPAAARKSERAARPSRLSAAATLAGQRLASVRTAATPEARLRATIDLANSLPVSEFAAWLDGGYFNLRGGAELTLFSKILRERWMKEDPEGFVAWSMKSNPGSSRALLSKWSDKEPQRVLDFLKTHPNAEQEMIVLQDIARNHPDLALRRFQELAASGISSKGASYVSGLMQALAEKSPAELQAALASLPAGLQFQAEAALSGQRLKASFATEIRALWEEPDGWKIFQTNAQQDRNTAAGLFDELANFPPAWKASLASSAYYFMNEETATRWLDADLTSFGFTAAQAKSIQKKALQAMDVGNPEAIIKRMGEVDLDEKARQNLIRNALTYTRPGPEKAEALIALLGSEADQAYARSVLKGRTENDDRTLWEKPADWLEKLGGLDVKNNNAYSIISSAENWAPEKISELKSQFNQLPDDKKQVVAQIIAGKTDSSSVGSEFRGEVIRYLAAHPEILPENKPENASEGLVAMASGYAVHLAVNDPDAAADWIRNLPAGDAKTWAEKNLASNWAQYDPKAVEQWLKTLPPASRDEVKTYLKTK